MDSGFYSRKRKLPSFTSLFSVFTRQESQIRKLPKRNDLIGAGADDVDAETRTISGGDSLSVPEILPRSQGDDSCSVIKDLRSRRVFSLNPKPTLSSGVGSDPKGRKLGKPLEGSLKSADDVITTSCSLVQERSSNKVIGRSLYLDDNENGELGYSDLDVDPTSFCESKTCRMKPDSQTKHASASEMTNRLGGSIDGGCIQTTPPEATEVLDGWQVEPNGGSRLPRRTGVVSEDSSAEFTRRDDSASKREVGRVPRYRGRIFKAPGSLSYRRLLPYLMEIANENSCTTRVSQGREDAKGLEGKSLQTFLGSGCNDIQIDESIEGGPNKTEVAIAPTITAKIGMQNGAPEDELENSLSISSMTSEDLGDRAVSGHVENTNSISVVQDSVLSVVNCNDAIGKVKVETVETIGSLTSIGSGICSVSSFPTEVKVDNQCVLDEPQPMNGLKQFQTVSPLISRSRESGGSCLAKGNGNGGDEALDQIDDLNEVEGFIPSPDPLLSGEAEPSKVENNEVKCFIRSSDPLLSGEAEPSKVESNNIKSVSVSAIGVPKNSSNSNVSKVDVNCSILNDSGREIAKSKMVLNPCSRLKYFKNQDSFNYRRMLPFLVEITKDSSCTPGNGQHEKLATRTNEQAALPPEPMKSQQFPTSQLNDDYISFEHNSSFPDSLMHGKSLGRDQLLQVENVRQNTHSKCESSHGSVCVKDEGNREEASSSAGFGCPNDNAQRTPSQSSEHVDFCAKSAPELSSDKKDNELGKSMQNPSQMVTLDHFRFLEEPSRRGILKRNPRGCRGLCSCLTCASFRLNAERAFEFSRNQMRDTEEVAFDLMKELAYLRAIVERTNYGASNPAFFQVREACKKATEAEEVAKDRLQQMNDDLNVHCRVVHMHRPRVAFSDHGQKLCLQEELASKGS